MTGEHSPETHGAAASEATETARHETARDHNADFWLEQARLNPGQVFINFHDIKTAPFIASVLKTAAEADPEFFQGQLGNIYAQADRDDMQTATETAILSDPRYSITAEEYPHLPEILAASTDPDVQLVKDVDAMNASEYKKKKATTLLQEIHDGALTPAQALEIVGDEDAWVAHMIRVNAQPNHLAAHAIDVHLSGVARIAMVEMNDLHEEPAAKRFKTLEGRGEDELYTYLVYAGEDAYPSTFNGTYDRLLQAMKKHGVTGDELLRTVGEGKLRTFVKQSLEYDRLGDFLSTMPTDAQERLIKTFVSGLDRQKDVGGEAGVVADALRLVRNPELRGVIASAVEREYKRVQQEDDEKGMATYGIISKIIDKDAAWIPEERAETYRLPDTSEISPTDLADQHGNVVERYFFYNDEDGQSSFQNFLSRFEGKPGWKIERHKGYVIVGAKRGGRGVKIYANEPASETTDDPTQPDVVSQAMQKDGAEASVVVHRGHVYHNNATIAHIPSSAKIVVLGSCGGYMSIESVLKRAPEAHIVSTQGTGTKRVNDTLLAKLDDYMFTDHFTWETFWEDAGGSLQRDPDFAKYIPPDKNFRAKFAYKYHKLTDVI